MGQSSVNLATMISSRICHDLISPIGAINNGMELLAMSGVAPGPEMELIQQSVGNASARIRFFRVAFGAAGEQTMSRSEITSILQDLTEGGKVGMIWGPTEGQSRADVRMAFLALQCLETALPYGGRIEVSEENGHWLIHCQAEKLNIEESLWSTLVTCDPPADLKPAQIQFLMMSLIAHETDRKIVTELGATEIKLRY